MPPPPPPTTTTSERTKWYGLYVWFLWLAMPISMQNVYLRCRVSFPFFVFFFFLITFGWLRCTCQSQEFYCVFHMCINIYTYSKCFNTACVYVCHRRQWMPTLICVLFACDSISLLFLFLHFILFHLIWLLFWCLPAATAFLCITFT